MALVLISFNMSDYNWSFKISIMFSCSSLLHIFSKTLTAWRDSSAEALDAHEIEWIMTTTLFLYSVVMSWSMEDRKLMLGHRITWYAVEKTNYNYHKLSKCVVNNFTLSFHQLFLCFDSLTELMFKRLMRNVSHLANKPTEPSIHRLLSISDQFELFIW